MAGPVVNLKQGCLRGAETNSEVGGSFFSFRGIPFAEPPVGNLRFKDPQPPQIWTGVREALKEGSQCVQRDELSHEIEGDDDCLYLNVYTTSLEGSRPVMVWIHGGAFMWGNGGTNFYGPDYLVKKDVVFVGINYRLGVFGFLSLDHQVAPGNMGLKDQVAALKWVKENIAQFGGDPNNVTIFGESAGGASTHFHLLSPLSKGLFHKAIAQSGVAFNPWARISKTVEFAQRLTAYLGKKLTDPIEIVEYLRTIPAHKLGEAQENILTAEEKMSTSFPFGPTVDSASTEPFLPRPARQLAAEGYDVPFMVGYNSHEGAIGLLGFSEDPEKKFNSEISCGLRDLPPSKFTDAVKEIKRFYFGDRQISEKVMEEYVQCMGDLLFANGIHEAVQTRVNNKTKSPTYLYRFFHDAPKSLSKLVGKLDIHGAAHADELVYFFRAALFNHITWIEPGSAEQVISERFVRMWTDFAKTGNPTPCLDDLITTKWEAVTSTTKNYLAITADLSSGVNPNEEMWQLWKGLRSSAQDH